MSGALSTIGLLPCPFCSSPAEMDARDSVSASHNFYHTSVVRISCGNPACQVSPWFHFEERIGLEKSKVAAAVIWNTRKGDAHG